MIYVKYRNDVSSNKRTQNVRHTFRVSVQTRDVRNWHKVDQIGPKWDKSWTFLSQISVNFQNELKSEMKKSRIFPICDQSDPLFRKI